MDVKKGKTIVTNQKGLVILESLPLILVMFVLLGATLGSWGIVHTAILNSISARHGTFFVLNNRSDLTYLRDFGSREDGYAGLVEPGAGQKFYYKTKGKRFVFIKSEKAVGTQDAHATGRFVNFIKKGGYGNSQGVIGDDGRRHSNIQRELARTPLGGAPNDRVKVDPAWIMVGYGICLTKTCGD